MPVLICGLAWQLLVIGVKPNEPCAPWRLRLLRPWLRYWTGLFLQLGLSFWNVRVKNWEHYREAEEARCTCMFLRSQSSHRSQRLMLQMLKTLDALPTGCITAPQCSAAGIGGAC